MRKDICLKCAKMFVCGQENRINCENYVSSRQAKEDEEYKIWLKKETKEMLEDEDN